MPKYPKLLHAFVTAVLCTLSINSHAVDIDALPNYQPVANNPYAIGYSGMGYLRMELRNMPLSPKTGEDFVEASEQNIVSGRYPLSRYLYVYVNKPPDQPLPLVQREFLRMILSDVGQVGVKNDGFIPLLRGQLLKERAKLSMPSFTKATATIR